MVQSPEVCRNFMHGRCQFGLKCRYLHPGKGGIDEREQRDLRDSRDPLVTARGERRERHPPGGHGYQQHHGHSRKHKRPHAGPELSPPPEADISEPGHVRVCYFFVRLCTQIG